MMCVAGTRSTGRTPEPWQPAAALSRRVWVSNHGADKALALQQERELCTNLCLVTDGHHDRAVVIIYAAVELPDGIQYVNRVVCPSRCVL